MSAQKDKTKEKEKPKEEEKEIKKEGAEGEAVEGEGAPKKSKKKLIIIIVAALVLIGGGVGGLLASGVLGGKKDVASKEGAKPEAVKDKDGKEIPLNKDGKPMTPAEIAANKSVFYNLPDIVVNLNSPTPRPHYVNLKLTLEVKNQATVKDVEDQLPRIIDSFNLYLRELRREDLDGSAGMYRLQKEMMLRLTKILGPDVVKDVLFREIIVQ